MTAPDPLHDLELLLRSRYGLVTVETVEEERLVALLRHVADRLDLPLFVWTRTKGLRRIGGSDGGDSDGGGSRGGGGSGSGGPDCAGGARGAESPIKGTPRGVYGTTELAGALDHMEAARFAGLYLLQGIGPELGQPVLVRRLRDVAEIFTDLPGAVVLQGPELAVPEELRPGTAALALPAPTLEELRRLLGSTLEEMRTRGRIRVELEPEEEDRLLRALQGLTLMEAEKALTRAIVEDATLSPDDLGRIARAKRDLVEREGLLEYYPAEEGLAEVADLDALKEWLAKREVLFSHPERAERFHLPFPRGILLLGVPGCGKSLSAKAVAAEWGLPLLRLDPSSLYNKYVGESERNFRRAIALAERLSPVVLFIDEIEKAFAVADEGDGGLSLRILGSFLSWMQERQGDVFVVATANEVSRLPPEMLRKGRFDEIFFVDLPDLETRRRIFEIHLEKRERDPESFDLGRLAEVTEGFSGSEIEQVVVSGLYTAASLDGELTTHVLLREAERTRPLSHTMAERVDALRRWASGRTVSAN